MNVAFDAAEYHADTRFRPIALGFDGDPETGWRVTRDRVASLALGTGYRAFRVVGCGVCSTDLARHFLPFPLPQVTGHEVLALDDGGRRVALEINASHAARGVDAPCPFCRGGLATHCPDRLVLGIHDLPGGFGPHVLAPVGAAVDVPDAIPDESAVLIEPLAAALHAVHTVAPRDGDRIAVLGPRRLGMLVVAALAAARATGGANFEIVALARREAMVALAREFGADGGAVVDGDGDSLGEDAYDVVIDTTGNPDAFALALRLARREVHVKSTHGRPVLGVAHLTELVVDELALAPVPSGPEGLPSLGRRPVVAWGAPTPPPAWLAGTADVRVTPFDALLADLDASPPDGGLPRADIAAVAGAAGIDRAIRPVPGREVSIVAPRGTIWVAPDAHAGDDLAGVIATRGVRVTSSRCGSFDDAVRLMVADARFRDAGAKLTTHRFDASDMNTVFDVARSPECIKAVVWHDGRMGPRA